MTVKAGKRVPKGRTGQPLRAASPLRRVLLNCHGWVRDRDALAGDWVWCVGCADLVRVAAVAD